MNKKTFGFNSHQASFIPADAVSDWTQVLMYSSILIGEEKGVHSVECSL